MEPYVMTGWVENEDGEMVEESVVIDDFPYEEPSELYEDGTWFSEGEDDYPPW